MISNRILRAMLAFVLAVWFFHSKADLIVVAQSVTISMPVSLPGCTQVNFWPDITPGALAKLGLAGNAQFLSAQANTKTVFLASVANCLTAAQQFRTAVTAKNTVALKTAFQAAQVENSQQSNLVDTMTGVELELMPGQNVSGVVPTVAAGNFVTGSSFQKGAVVHFNGMLYIAKATTATTDVPGTSAVWTELIWGPEIRTLIANLT